ncbi:MAG: tetratricopeptide repeat protein [Planctomycetaceae bacterium]|nr:tetratricopeptide repeat protein [Planctomycetaceae bacterium]
MNNNVAGSFRHNQGNWNGGNWNRGDWNAGNWNRGNWNGNNWNRNGWGWNRGFGFSPWWGIAPWGIGGLGWGWGWPYYGLGTGLGWGFGSPFFGYNRFCGYGGYGYPAYGYSSFGTPYTTAYADVAAPVEVAQVTEPAVDDQVAADDFAGQGEAQFLAGDYAGAARSWRHAIVDDPHNATLLLMMSQALFATGNYDEAAGALQMGLMQMPEEQWGVVVENYKELYAPNDDYANQLKELEKAAKEKPDDPARQVLLGYHYGFLGYPVQSVVRLNRTMELAPQDLMAQKLREVMAAKAAAKGLTVEPAPKLPDNPLPVPATAPAADGVVPAAPGDAEKPALPAGGPALPEAAVPPGA